MWLCHGDPRRQTCRTRGPPPSPALSAAPECPHITLNQVLWLNVRYSHASEMKSIDREHRQVMQRCSSSLHPLIMSRYLGSSKAT